MKTDRFGLTRRRFMLLSAGGLAGVGLVHACSELDAGEVRVRVVVLADDVVRIQIAPAGGAWPGLGPEPSVVAPDAGWSGVRSAEDPLHSVTTPRLRVELSRDPWRLTVRTAEGALLIGDLEIDAAARRASWDLPADEHIFGFGDQRAALDKRGTSFEVRSSDSDLHQGDPFATYKAVPFLLSTRGYGVYLNTTWRSRWHFDAGAGRTTVEQDGGSLDFYLFLGPSFATIVGHYTTLTGRPALLPRWAFGFHQGGAGNDVSPAWADGIGAAMRARQLPIDVVYYDDWVAETFTPEFVRKMWDEHRLKITAGLGMPVAMVDSPLWKRLRDLSPPGLITDGAGAILRYTGYGLDGELTEVDYFNPAAVDAVFADTWSGPLDAGVFDGMVDFGELSFVPAAEAAYFPSFANPRRSVEELHNVYGLVYAERLLEKAATRTGSRRVGMARPGAAGSQRFGWTWTADSVSAWTNTSGLGGLQEHVRAVLGLSMSGFSTVGFDIGGWSGGASDALYLRWFQAGMYLPYASAHGEGDHTIFARPPDVIDRCRSALEQRYRLLPYLYGLHFEAHLTGVPMVRTLAFATDGEPGTEGVGDQWFLGPWLLVAPVMNGPDDATSDASRDVYLPAGDWIDLADGVTVKQGPAWLRAYPAPLDRVPVFVRAGAIIPMAPLVQHAMEPLPDGHALTLQVFPSSAPTSYTLIEDDGEYGHEQGRSTARTFGVVRAAGATRLSIDASVSQGGFDPGPRDWMLVIHQQPASPSLVRLDGEPLAQTTAEALDAGAYGWQHDPAAQLVRVRIADTAPATAIDVEAG